MAVYLKLFALAILQMSSLVVAIRAENKYHHGPVVRSTLMDQQSRNQVLTNHVIKSNTKKSWTRCVAACLEEEQCVSINYGDTGGICELNASHKDAHPGDVVDKDGWRYYGTQEKTPVVERQLTTKASTIPLATDYTTEPTTIAETTNTPTPDPKESMDCWDIKVRTPSSVSGVYTVYPDKRDGSLQVYCDMDTEGGGWTVFQRRIDQGQDFNLDWTSYKAGFGDITRNFWLGNDALYELTTQRDYQIRIELQHFNLGSSYAKYRLFRIDSEADKYRLTLGAFYGSYVAGNSFSDHDGSFFSTKDRDNDRDSRDCAETFMGAWWFDSCISCDLNGPYRTSHHVPYIGQGIVWGKWPDLGYSLRFTEMKIRPIAALTQAKDCWDLYTMGSTTSGIYTIHVSGRDQPMPVYCDMDSTDGGWTVIQRRKDGSQNFYLYWADYKVGFGNLSGEFWLGNDVIHLLTNQDAYQLNVKLTSWDGIIKYANYKEFKVANEDNLYRLSVDHFSGSPNVGDSLKVHSRMAWSTRDRKNDLAPSNWYCAVNLNAAWWYNNCYWSNLNGPYVHRPGTTSMEGKGIIWGSWKQYWYSFPEVEMEIRPAHVGFDI